MSVVVDPDSDSDGFVLSGGDCNDNDDQISPGATEVPCDGIDQDCDGLDACEVDADFDGYPISADCDDANDAIHPGALEITAAGRLIDAGRIGEDIRAQNLATDMIVRRTLTSVDTVAL